MSSQSHFCSAQLKRHYTRNLSAVQLCFNGCHQPPPTRILRPFAHLMSTTLFIHSPIQRQLIKLAYPPPPPSHHCCSLLLVPDLVNRQKSQQVGILKAGAIVSFSLIHILYIYKQTDPPVRSVQMANKKSSSFIQTNTFCIIVLLAR